MYNHIINSLPKTPNILGRDRYFNSVVFIPFLDIDGEQHILFQKRAKNIRQGGEISFPGGGFEPLKDKNYKETAIRETVEELGIKPDDIVIDGQMDTLVTPNGAIIEIFVGRITDSDFLNYPINKDEVEKLFTVPFSYFKDTEPDTYLVRHEIQTYTYDSNGSKVKTFPTKKLNLPVKYHDSWGGRQSEIYLYQVEGETIWGITGLIMKYIANL